MNCRVEIDGGALVVFHTLAAYRYDVLTSRRRDVKASFLLFAHKEDAERVLEVLGKRLGKYGLQLSGTVRGEGGNVLTYSDDNSAQSADRRTARSIARTSCSS